MRLLFREIITKDYRCHKSYAGLVRVFCMCLLALFVAFVCLFVEDGDDDNDQVKSLTSGPYKGRHCW